MYVFSINLSIEKCKEFTESDNFKDYLNLTILKYYLNRYLDHLIKEMFIL